MTGTILVNKDYLNDLVEKSKAYELACMELEKIGRSSTKKIIDIDFHRCTQWQEIFINRVKENNNGIKKMYK